MGKISTVIDALAIGCLGISFLLGHIIRITPFPGITVAPHDIVLAVWVIALVLIGKNKPTGSLIPSAVLLTGALLLSLIASLGRFSFPEYIVGMMYLLRIGLYFFVYAFCKNGQIQWLTRMLFITGLAVCVLGLIQYIFYWDLRNLSYLGWDPHYRRLFSTILDPNIAGLVIVFTLSQSVMRFIGSRKLPDALWVTLCSIALLLTYSRSSLLAAFVACVIVLIVQKKYRVLVAAIAGFCTIAAFLVSPNQSYSILRVDTALARLGNWREGWGIWSRSPVFGVGFNMLRSIREPGFIQTDPAAVSHAGGGIDNWVLLLGATAGIPGVFAGFYFFWKIVRIAIAEKKHLFVLFSLCAVLIHGMFVNTIFYPWTFLWLLVLVKQAEYKQRLICDTKPSVR